MKKLILAALAASCALPVMAQDDFYMGASVGRASQKLSEGGVSLKDRSTAGAVFGGYQFNDMLGAEIGYTQLGDWSVREGGAVATLKPKTFYAALTGTVPLGNGFAVIGKLGAARTRTTASASFLGFGDSARNTEASLMAGLGVAYALNEKVALVAEYENFGKIVKEDTGSLKADKFSAGVRFKF